MTYVSCSKARGSGTAVASGSALLIVFAAALALVASPASAQSYPTCPFIMTCDTPANAIGQVFRITVNRTQVSTTQTRQFVTAYQLIPGSSPYIAAFPSNDVSITSFYVKNKHSSMYLTNSGSNAVQTAFAASPAQSWNFEPTSYGDYWLRSLYDTTKVLDVYGSGLSGTNVQVFDKKSVTGDINQRFTQTDRGSGSISLHPAHDLPSAVEVTAWSVTSGAQVETYTYGGGDNQLWSKEASCHQYVANGPYVWNFPGDQRTFTFDGVGGNAFVSSANGGSVQCRLVEQY